MDRIEDEIVKLSLIDEPTTLDAGSIQIDEAFEEIVKERLSSIRHRQPQLSEDVGHRMANGEFQHIKSSFGMKRVDLIPASSITVPGLPKDFNDHEAKIENGTVIISRCVDLLAHQ